MKKYGFTLAEILITLAIIGTVAALTIPTVVRNYQKHQTVTQLKKVYSALSNTTNLAIAEHDPIEGWAVYAHNTIVPNTSMRGSEHFVKTYLMPYLKVSKDCGLSTNDICSYEAKHLNGNALNNFQDSYAYKFILNDGTLIAPLTRNFIYSQDGTRYIRAEVSIDLNGSKKPNTLGKDVYTIVYVLISADNAVGKFRPSGYDLSRNTLLTNTSYGCNENASGLYCMALIMRDSWQIKDDYPW